MGSQKLPVYSLQGDTMLKIQEDSINSRLSKLESIEVRPVCNGFLVTTRTEDDEFEFVFDSHQKTLRFIKKQITPVE